MAGEFIKPNNIVPAVLGQIANPDDYNQNIAGQSKGAIVGIDIDGSFADVDLGDEALITNGALIKDIKLREGYFLKYYNSSGVFQRNVNLGQATTSLIGQVFLQKPITIANNVSDANNDINFGAGVFQFDDGSGQAVATALTKRLDATFVAGNNQGGLDTGAKANSTRYYMFAIYNPTTLVSDFLFSASKASPTMPSGYTKKQYLGCAITDGSGNIRNGTYYVSKSQYEFVYNSAMIVDLNITNPPTGSRSAATITAPINSYALLSVTYQDDDGFASSLLLTSAGQTDTVPAAGNATISASNGTITTVPPTYFLLDSNAYIYYRGNDGLVNTCIIATKGWKEFY